ncbi:hypothetical protein N665_1274s0012 [Sinapis alba]|nr:hypothetical protein N665_1274s0012 [Sinapis alba]
MEEKLARVYATGPQRWNVEKPRRNERGVCCGVQGGESGKVFQTIDLSSEEFKLLPEVFCKFVGLGSLNISDNDLTFIPDAVSKRKKLEELDVSSNSLESLPDSIRMLLNLRILNVTAINLNSLPESISHCKFSSYIFLSLVELDASYNNLISLHTNIGYGLQNFERLSIQLKKFRYFPGSIIEICSLKYLDSHMNDIIGISDSIGRLTKLVVLNLSSNINLGYNYRIPEF